MNRETKLKTVSAVILLGVATIAHSATIPSSFNKAKKVLNKHVINSDSTTIYSGCRFAGKKIDLASCNLQDSFSKKWAKRKWCSKYDADYRKATSDLVNLYPSVGAINGKRSAKPFAEKPSGKNKQTFNGNLKVTVTSRVIVPPLSIRGDVARIAGYMNRYYGVTYSKRQNALFAKWDKTDPISSEEMKRCQSIRKAQGRCVLD